MKTVQNTEKVTLILGKDEIINGKWVALSLVSEKLADKEKELNLNYRSLKSRFYNSCNCKKYNLQRVAGVMCISVDEPVVATASLELSFEVK